MKKNQMRLLIAKPLTVKEKKAITGGAAGVIYYCNVDLSTACNNPYSSLAACLASGCPTNKCSRNTLCPA